MSMTAPISDAGPVPRNRRPEPASRPIVVDVPAVNTPKFSAIRGLHWLPINRATLIAFMISLFLHVSLLGGLAYIVLESREEQVSSLTGLLGNSDDAPADFLLDSGTAFDVGGSTEPTELFSSTNNSDAIGEMIASKTSRVGGFGEGNGKGDGEGDGEGIGIAEPTLNVPEHAVSKGSFSAWTVPENPLPNRNYFIVIQVRLPESLAKNGKYRARDLTGMVNGTDTFRKRIHFRTNDVFEVKNGVVQIEIVVPGGAEMVRDTIQIQSKMLKEKQMLQLVFQKQKLEMEER